MKKTRNRKSGDPVERFMRFVPDRPEGECWEWSGYRYDGYGRFYYLGRQRQAHRVALVLFKGFDPSSDLFACHRCDNRGCVNPDHLFIGTNDDNMKDCAAKGRSARGDRSGTARLREAWIPDIRRLAREGWTLERIASKYGVFFTTIAAVVRGETWSHVPDVERSAIEEAIQEAKVETT